MCPPICPSSRVRKVYIGKESEVSVTTTREGIMMSRRMSWLSKIEAGVLIWGMLLTGSGPGVASAASPTTEEILAKVDQILTAIGSIQGGNATLRWDQNLPAAQRFVVLAAFNNQAVLDKETGLVWEQAPSTTNHTWSEGRIQCLGRTIGDRKGWRLPSVSELFSLVDTASSSPSLPLGHPFIGVQPLGFYWSSTSNAEDSTRVWGVSFSQGSIFFPPKTVSFLFVWCVRGPMQESVY